MDDRIAITTFIAYYSLFGTAEADLVRSHSKDAINLFVQVFEEELDSKVDLRIRLNWLLAFYNIYTSHLSGSPTAKIASKGFSFFTNSDSHFQSIRSRCKHGACSAHLCRYNCNWKGGSACYQGRFTVTWSSCQVQAKEIIAPTSDQGLIFDDASRQSRVRACSNRSPNDDNHGSS